MSMQAKPGIAIGWENLIDEGVVLFLFARKNWGVAWLQNQKQAISEISMLRAPTRSRLAQRLLALVERLEQVLQHRLGAGV